MKLSVGIVSWESTRELPQCLKAVFEAKAGWEYEVLVIDNGSRDGSAELIRKEFPKVRLLENHGNRGFAKGVNQGMTHSRGDYLLLLNPDVVLLPGALEAMAGYLDSHPDVGALAPQMVFPDGTIQASCREFPSYQVLLWEMTGLSRLFPRHRILGRWKMGYFDHATEREVDQPMASCFLLRREVLEKTGYLDEDFPLYFNDVDWCYRMREEKVKMVFFPGAQAVHDLGASTARYPYGKVLLHKGMHDFLTKHDTGRLKFLWKPLFWIPLLLSSKPMGWRFFFQDPLEWEL
jgi:GT2 family glycosyltransferase